MGLPAYKKWKNTKVQWPESIPEHWELKQFRYLFNFGRGLGITKANLLDEGIPCINYGEIHSKFGFEVDPERHDLKCVDEAYLETGERSLLEHGDFVFADTSEDIEGSGNFSYLNSELPTFAGYHTVVAKPATNNDARFLAYLIDSRIFRFQIRKNVSGVKVYSITQDILKNCYAWLPTEDEQKKIVNFLDYKTSQIDQLIEKKKALIEKLDEQRIAVITQAVTKGIDENAKMRPSGVEWLGDVPEHWDVKRLRYVIRTTKGYAFKSSDFSTSGVLVVKASDIKNKTIIRSNVYLPESFSHTYESVKLKENDIVISTVGSTADVINSAVGQVGKVPIDCDGALLNQNTVILKPHSGLDNKYLEYLVAATAFREHLDINAHGTANQASLSLFDILNFRAALPSPEERVAISIYLDKKTACIDSIIKASKDIIIRLNEYRSSLITSTVTGKIDVQNIQLPQGE